MGKIIFFDPLHRRHRLDMSIKGLATSKSQHFLRLFPYL